MQTSAIAQPTASSPTPRPTWTLVLTSLAAFMAVLDTLVVTTALPVMRVELKAGVSDLEWIVNAYLLAFACFLLTGAALGDRFGRRRMLVVGLSLFTAASVGAALSTNTAALIAARVAQGAGAAIALPLTLTLIAAAFPPEKRSAAIGIWTGVSGLAVAGGPVVGGAVVDGLNWHWIFWINVPIGLVLIPLAALRLTESVGSRSQLDIPGVALAGLGLLGLTWGLVRANTAGWFSGEVMGTLLAGAVLVGLFLGWEQRASHPMLPLRFFRRRGFAAPNAVGFFLTSGLIGTLFLMMQLFQTALGYSPLQAGLRILPWTATPMIVAPLTGRLASRYGNRPFMALGLALQAIGLAWVAVIAGPDMGYVQLGLALVVAGVGTSMCLPTTANTVVGSVSPPEAGVASGAYNVLRQLGGVFGVAVLAAVFTREGGYASPQLFIDGFIPALWVGAGLSALGVIAALLSPGRPRLQKVNPAASPLLAAVGNPDTVSERAS